MSPSVIALIVAAVIVVIGGFTFEHFIWIRPLEAREKARVAELVREKMIEAERLKEVAQQGIEAARKQALLEATVELIQKFKLQKSVTLLSFDHQIIARAKKLAPAIRTAATLPLHSIAVRTHIKKTRSLTNAA